MSTAKTAQRKFVGFFVDLEAVGRLQQLAVSSDRSMSAELRRAVDAHLQAESSPESERPALGGAKGARDNDDNAKPTA